MRSRTYSELFFFFKKKVTTQCAVLIRVCTKINLLYEFLRLYKIITLFFCRRGGWGGGVLKSYFSNMILVTPNSFLVSSTARCLAATADSGSGCNGYTQSP